MENGGYVRILVLTTIFKDIDDPNDAATTPVVQNFAKEWVKQGHEVVLIHNFNIFPMFFYCIPQKILDILSAQRGFRTILTWSQRRDLYYERDGVKVYRSTVKKSMPLGSYTKFELERSVVKIKKFLNNEHFQPELIIAHMENPQIYQLEMLKKLYPNSITSLVFHQIDYLHKKKYAKWRDEYLPNIDRVGFRSQEVYREACNLIGFDREDYYLCPSGISDEFVKSIPEFASKFQNNQILALFVGQFIPRKHVETIVQAVSDVNGYNGVHLCLELIGGGIEESRIHEMATQANILSNIIFNGRQSHSVVMKKMQESDLFIMVSEKEVFGLVYTEAMSQGCIVIASTEGGMEGIIQDGVNGYLSQAGDADALARKIRLIISQGREKNIEMAKESYNTALKYTERAVAEKYLANILGQQP